MLTKQEENTLIKIENLIGLHEKQLFKKPTKVTTPEGDYIITKDDFIDFINLIEKHLQVRKQRNQKVNEFNKNHKEYHKIINSIHEARKTSNIKRLEYWQNKLNEYKGVSNNGRN